MTLRSSRGQAIVEFAFVLPVLLMVALGVIEMSYLLHDQHVVIRLTREAANLISRPSLSQDTSFSDAVSSMTSMANPPVNFSGSNSKLILSVIERHSGGTNDGKVIVSQRLEAGTLASSSAFLTQGSITGAFNSANNYKAIDPNGNTNLRVTNVPASLALSTGQMVYVAEIYTKRSLLTPVANFGITLPSTLYSIAYF